MSTGIGLIKLRDNRKFFIVYHNTSDTAYPFLYNSPEKAWEDYKNNFAARNNSTKEEKNLNVEPAYLYYDLCLDTDYQFTTLISLNTMLIVDRLEGTEECFDWIKFYQDLDKLKQSLDKKKKLRILQFNTPQFDAPSSISLYILDSSINLSQQNYYHLSKVCLLEIVVFSGDEQEQEKDLLKKVLEHTFDYFARHNIDFEAEIVCFK